MLKNIFTFIAFIFIAVTANSQTTVHYPGVQNGTKILFTPQGTSTASPKGYCNLIGFCIYNVSNCAVDDAFDAISTDSDPETICRIKGFTQAISHTTGTGSNPFGRVRKYDGAGNFIYVGVKKQKSLKCGLPDPAARSFLYDSTPESIMTSITCL